MLLVLGALAFGAKAQTPMVKDSLPFEGQLQKAQQKIDSLQKVIQQLTTKTAVSPQKITNRKITFYQLNFTIGKEIEAKDLFREIEVVAKKQVKVSKKVAETLSAHLVNNPKPAYKVKCPLNPQYGLSVEVEGQVVDYLVSFTCGNIHGHLKDELKTMAIKDEPELKQLLEDIFKKK